MTPLAVTLLALALLAAPLVGEAQPAGKVCRIGMLETRSTVLNAANIDAFRQGLRELGYKEGQNLEIEYRSSDGRDERFPGLASALVGLKVDVILTRGTPAALAAKSATRTIPVVMAASGDPACITERPPLLTESSKAPNPPTSPSSSPRSSSWCSTSRLRRPSA